MIKNNLIAYLQPVCRNPENTNFQDIPMISSRGRFIELVEQGAVPAEKISDALWTAGIFPDGRAWRVFMERLLLWLGGLALAFAAMYFIAYNWHVIGRFAKFGMVQGAMILAIAAFCRFPEQSAAGRVSLLVAAICLGVLLALYGQTYQTGADPWQLFFTWAVLMLPWAVIGRFAAIWILWAALLNITIILYCRTFPGAFRFLPGSESGMFWLTFLFNTLVLAVWELLWQMRGRAGERWALRLAAGGSAVPLTLLALQSVFDHHGGGLPAVLVWAAWLAVLYFIYRKTRPDLFMLVCGCLSAITVVVAFLGRHMLEEFYAGGFLVLALAVVGMGSAAAFWLKNVHQEIHS